MKNLPLLIAAVAIMALQPWHSAHAQSNTPAPALEKKQKNEVLNSLLKQLNDNYVFPEVAKAAEKKIREYQKKGAYDEITDAKEFAKTLTEQLRETVHDKHLGVRYNPIQPVGNVRDTVADKAREEAFMRFMKRMNLGLPKLDILDGNIGYLKMDGFGPVDKVGKTLSAAITFLANTDALIIDMRDNHGGEPSLVQYMVSHFFDGEPIHINDLYFRPGNRTEEFWTVPVEGVKYLDKPVYVLTSGHTFSAGEEFTYDLQQLKRATIVGETTGGGANPGDEVPLAHGFTAFVPTGRAINPITKTNWEGVGVKPDVATPAADALKEAHVLALKAVIEKTPEAEKGFYKERLEKILVK